MKEYQAVDLRNLAIVGHASCGKTMLSEAMLACAGVINRMGTIPAGTTVSDYHESEQQRLISVSTTLMHLEWQGKKFNVLDCPGYADFISEALGALRAVADAGGHKSLYSDAFYDRDTFEATYGGGRGGIPGMIGGDEGVADPRGVTTLHVETARQMQAAVESLLPADALWGKDALVTQEMIEAEDGRAVRTLTIGVAGETLSRIATIHTGSTSVAGQGGFGAVMGSKKLKAIAAYGRAEIPLADPKEFKETLRRTMKFVIEDLLTQALRVGGTVLSLDAGFMYGDVPRRYYTASESAHLENNVNMSTMAETMLTRHLACFRCPIACNREVHLDKYQEPVVDGPEYETAAALGSNMAVFDPLYVIEQNFYCDTYGICSISWGNIMAFIMECWEAGILDKERTGGLDFTWGNAADALECMHQLARGEGFGLIAGLGVRKMKEMFIEKGWGDASFLNDIAMENKGMEYSMYISKESLAQQGGYAMTNKGPQHDEAWLIFMDMVNNQIPTFEDKAEALHYFPMFRTWFGLAGFCKLCWNDIEPADNARTAEPAKVPEHVDNYVTVFNAVTGSNIDKHSLIRMSERVYNFQRVFNIRMGKGLRRHDAQPYRACGPVTEEEYQSRQARYDKQLKEEAGIDPSGMTLTEKHRALRSYREDRYEKLLDAVYKRRGWNKNGVPRVEFLKEIGMDLPELLEVVTPLQ